MTHAEADHVETTVDCRLFMGFEVTVEEGHCEFDHREFDRWIHANCIHREDGVVGAVDGKALEIILEFGSLDDGLACVVNLVIVKDFPNPSVACIWEARREVRGGDH